MSRHKVETKNLVSTQEVAKTVSPEELSELYDRHLSGDWGECCKEDRQGNEASLRDRGQLHSTFTTKAGKKLWIITDPGWDVTTALWPDEY